MSVTPQLFETLECDLAGLNTLVDRLMTLFPQGAVVGLSGDLGSGKTTLVRHFIHSAAKKQKTELPRVTSPSFTLLQAYEQLNPPIYHMDLYRLNGVSESTLVDLGYYECVERVKQHQAWLFVEWPSRCVKLEILSLTIGVHLEMGQGFRRYRLG